MSFESPFWLLLLLPVVALLVGYLLLQRHRRAQLVRFTSVDLLASVAPRRTGWQRHLASVGVLLALVVLALAVAGPAVTTAVARERATVMLTVDTSASMLATDIDPSRLAVAQQQGRDFVTGLPNGVQVGLVGFDSAARTLVPPTTEPSQIERALSGLQVGAGTATAAGIRTALAAITAQQGDSSKQGDSGQQGAPVAAIVLMSDGAPTVGDPGSDPTADALAAAAAAKKAGVPIYTIAYGTADGVVSVQGQQIPVPVDPDTMAKIAEASGGAAFTAQSASQLRGVYDQIGRAVAYDLEQVDLTGAFAGAGFALALLGAVAGLYWTQRIY